MAIETDKTNKTGNVVMSIGAGAAHARPETRGRSPATLLVEPVHSLLSHFLI
jgi:hypothetical protein